MFAPLVLASVLALVLVAPHDHLQIIVTNHIITRQHVHTTALLLHYVHVHCVHVLKGSVHGYTCKLPKKILDLRTESVWGAFWYIVKSMLRMQGSLYSAASNFISLYHLIILWSRISLVPTQYIMHARPFAFCSCA